MITEDQLDRNFEYGNISDEVIASLFEDCVDKDELKDNMLMFDECLFWDGVYSGDTFADIFNTFIKCDKQFRGEYKTELKILMQEETNDYDL